MQVHMSNISLVELTLPLKTAIWALGDQRVSTFCTMLNIASQIKPLSTMSQVCEYSFICHHDTDLPGLHQQSVSHMCCIIDAALDMVHRILLCGSGSLSSEVPVWAIAGNCDFSNRLPSVPQETLSGNCGGQLLSYVTQFFCCINLSEGRSTLSMGRACRISLYSILNVTWCGTIILLQYDNTHLPTLHSAVSIYGASITVHSPRYLIVIFYTRLTRCLLTSMLPSADSGEMSNMLDVRNPTNVVGHSPTQRADFVHVVTLLSSAYCLIFVPIYSY